MSQAPNQLIVTKVVGGAVSVSSNIGHQLTFLAMPGEGIHTTHRLAVAEFMKQLGIDKTHSAKRGTKMRPDLVKVGDYFVVAPKKG